MAISDKIRKLIDNAWADGYPCLLATTGPGGPNVSVKGSMLVFDDQHLAYWERSKKGALENLGHEIPLLQLKVGYYLTDMTQQNILNEISARTFGPGNPPARTLVAVPELAHPDMMIEVEGVAAVPVPAAKITMLPLSR